MTEAQVLLSKIAALRQRLEQAQGLVQDADSAAAALMQGGHAVEGLEGKVAAGARQQALLDTALRQLPSFAGAAGDGASLPTQLTSRAARLLRRAHDLLGQLRATADDVLLPIADNDPLAQLYRETAGMTDTVLRIVQAFPEAPSAQIRLCEGLEAMLQVVADRLTTITGALCQRRHEASRRHQLADLLSALAAGHSIEGKALVPVAESVYDDAVQNMPLVFPDVSAARMPEHVAAHSLAVAQIIARLARHDGEWRTRPLEPIVAALVHDVGMLKLPPGLLEQSGPLPDEERRLIEAHPLQAADMAGRVTPSTSWLVEAATQHHERLDGSGYPGGLRELQLKPLVRLLAVCDVYAAMCQPRAYRAALDTRTALADTLLLAEKGLLDRNWAERLLQLSFYPIGSVVELSDGAVGLVVATHQGRRDLNTPARPVVALLTDAQGQLLPTPRHVDLSESEGRSILRGLSAAERRERVGRRYPELVGG
jgi:HD-GYP domain-containing protein (c-di-GMP phosphodiesterase class II)